MLLLSFCETKMDEDTEIGDRLVNEICKQTQIACQLLLTEHFSAHHTLLIRGPRYKMQCQLSTFLIAKWKRQYKTYICHGSIGMQVQKM